MAAIREEGRAARAVAREEGVATRKAMAALAAALGTREETGAAGGESSRPSWFGYLVDGCSILGAVVATGTAVCGVWWWHRGWLADRAAAREETRGEEEGEGGEGEWEGEEAGGRGRGRRP